MDLQTRKQLREFCRDAEFRHVEFYHRRDNNLCETPVASR